MSLINSLLAKFSPTQRTQIWRAVRLLVAALAAQPVVATFVAHGLAHNALLGAVIAAVEVVYRQVKPAAPVVVVKPVVPPAPPAK